MVIEFNLVDWEVRVKLGLYIMFKVSLKKNNDFRCYLWYKNIFDTKVWIFVSKNYVYIYWFNKLNNFNYLYNFLIQKT